MIALTGCATAPPDLPRITQQTTERGFMAQAHQPSTPLTPGSLVTPAAPTVSQSAPVPKRIAMITRPVWKALTTEEHAQIEAGYESRIVEPEGFGMIIDVQGADQSIPGTNAGAALGGAIGSAAYIDRSLGGGNYSAGGHLALGLLGAVIGSGMDRAPTTQFQFRYTVKQGDGEIQYFDEFKTSSFRHSVGVCVLLPDLALISQQVCQQTVDSARLRYLQTAVK